MLLRLFQYAVVGRKGLPVFFPSLYNPPPGGDFGNSSAIFFSSDSQKAMKDKAEARL